VTFGRLRRRSVEQMQNRVTLAQDVLKARTKGLGSHNVNLSRMRLSAPPAPRAAATMTSAKASLLEANLGLVMAQRALKRAMGEIPRETFFREVAT
jgi:hypothetical protein